VAMVICTAISLPLKHHTQLLISGVNPVLSAADEVKL
jgi:hypothetical protein